MFAIALDTLPELEPDAFELKLDVAKKEEGVHLPKYFAAGVSALATIADGDSRGSACASPRWTCTLTDERFRVTSTVRWGIVDLLSQLHPRWPANVLHVDFGHRRVHVQTAPARARPEVRAGGRARRVLLAAIKRFVCAVATKSVTVLVGHSSRARVASFDVADMCVPV